MARTRREITDILVEVGTLKASDAQRAVAESTRSHRPLHEVILDLKLASEEEITKALANKYDMEFIDLDKSAMAASNVNLIPPDLIKKHQVLPMEKKDGVLRIVIGDPTDIDTIDALKFRLNTKLETCLGVKSKIKQHIQRLFAEDQASIDKAVRNAASIDTSGNSIDLKAQGKQLDADDAPIIKLTAQIISAAVKDRASDIHIEPMKDRVRIRYRIDGVCVERDNIAKRMQAPITARIKILSGMDIAEKRLPQDGRIKMIIEEKQVDFRVSALPGYHGESIVLRILRPDSVKIGIQSMGFEEEDYARFKRVISRPNGIFLVTGPTGSGKTTTLYGALQELNKPDKKIITAEDPVEYNFAGINQCQVREVIGLSFAKILRSMLRQAPNIILVGEIRDLEVAEVAIQAALTGHLVFSTLHTNDAPSAITRLIDMGVKPFLVASSIQAIMGKALIRTLCPKCKAPDTEPDKKFLALMGFTDKELQGRTIMRAVGCPNCNNTGYKGRKGIFEMMVMNNEVREMAFKRATTNLIRKAARASGMKSLLDDGKVKILNGITTPAEIARVAQADGLAPAGEAH